MPAPVRQSPPSPIRRVALSTKHITGCVLALGGPALAFAGVVTPVVGLTLVPVLYAVGAIVAPKKRTPEQVTLRKDSEAVGRALNDVRARSMGRIPWSVQSKIARVATAIENAVPRAATVLDPADRDRYVLVQSATDYLPGALDAYLAMPRSYADQQTLPDGRTPLAVLSEQVDRIAANVDRIVAKIQKLEADRLLVHERYLDAALPDDDARDTPAT